MILTSMSIVCPFVRSGWLSSVAKSCIVLRFLMGYVDPGFGFVPELEAAEVFIVHFERENVYILHTILL